MVIASEPPPASRPTEEALKNSVAGQKVMENEECTGIFLGICEMKGRNGVSLGKFRVIGAPEDLTDESGTRTLLTFTNTAKVLTGKKNWHGYDGGSLAVLENDTGLYKGLANGSALRKWVFPTRDLLCGKDLDGLQVQADNLYAYKDKSDFKGTYITVGPGNVGNSGYPVWYWSCTEHRGNQSLVVSVDFSDGDDGWDGKGYNRLSCRPVRFEVLSI